MKKREPIGSRFFIALQSTEPEPRQKQTRQAHKIDRSNPVFHRSPRPIFPLAFAFPQ